MGTDHSRERTLACHIPLQRSTTKSDERILKAARGTTPMAASLSLAPVGLTGGNMPSDIDAPHPTGESIMIFLLPLIAPLFSGLAAGASSVLSAAAAGAVTGTVAAGSAGAALGATVGAVGSAATIAAGTTATVSSVATTVGAVGTAAAVTKVSANAIRGANRTLRQVA
jgi:hypothetical protein